MTSSQTYGSYTYGSGGYSSIEHVDEDDLVLTDDFVDTLTDIQSALDPLDGEVNRAAELLSEQYVRLTYNVDVLYDERYVDTATGTELDRLGANVGVRRPTGESDAKFRKRVKAGYVTANSRGTFSDVARAAVAILDCDTNQVSLERARHTSEAATARLSVEGTVLDNSLFTNTEIKDVLSDALVGGHRLELQRNDVFTWGDSTNGWDTEWGSPSDTS